jgi:uncharacterized protein YeaO (DUF488 family)
MATTYEDDRIQLRRIYDDPGEHEGYRVLVDRIWPRGISKEKARIDEWRRDIAPSTELRRWFGHDPERWEEFRSRYRSELANHSEQLDPLVAAARAGPLTLLYGARDERHNQAVVLKEFLEERLNA